jgi:hypothetical protein
MYRLQTHVHTEIERLANLDGGAEALAKKLLEAQQQAEDAEFAVGQQVWVLLPHTWLVCLV